MSQQNSLFNYYKLIKIFLKMKKSIKSQAHQLESTTLLPRWRRLTSQKGQEEKEKTLQSTQGKKIQSSPLDKSFSVLTPLVTFLCSQSRNKKFHFLISPPKIKLELLTSSSFHSQLRFQKQHLPHLPLGHVWPTPLQPWMSREVLKFAQLQIYFTTFFTAPTHS
jgi:hypothetical protein